MDDEEFIDQYAAAYGTVQGHHLFLQQPDEDIARWEIRSANPEAPGESTVVADVYDEKLAVWFTQAHINADRISVLLRDFLDDAERAEVEKDRIIAEFIRGERSHL